MNQVLVLIASLAFLVFFIWYLATTQDKTRRWVALAVIGSMLLICALSLFIKNGKPGINIKEGLDLKGGTQFTIQLAGTPSSAALDQAVEVIRKRVDAQGVAEPVIQPAGGNRILVQIPGINEIDKQKYRQQLERVAKLEFKSVLPDYRNLLPDVLSGKAQLPFDCELLPFKENTAKGSTSKSFIIVKKRAGLSGKHVKSAWASADQLGRPEVNLEFDGEGAQQFERLTTANVGNLMAIVLDGEVYSAPVIKQPLSSRCSISGGSMKRAEAIELASVLENPLETPVSIVDERGVDPTLGAASIQSGFQAGLLGILFVAGFALLYYRIAGVVAVIALFVNLFILLGLLAQFGLDRKSTRLNSSH